MKISNTTASTPTSVLKATAATEPSDRDAIPVEMMDVSSKSSSDEEGEETVAEAYDQFDASGVPMPRIESSSTPFVLEVAPRNGRLGSKDPLFQGVCLYDGNMTTEQVEKYNYCTSPKRNPVRYHPSQVDRRSSWSLSSVFRFFSTSASGTH